MSTKPIAFLDLDGTLVDSMRRQHELLLVAMREYGYEEDTEKVSFQVFADMKREGKNTKAIAQSVGVDDPRVLTYWGTHIEDVSWLEKDTFFEDALPFLYRLSKTYEVQILTARRNPYVIEWVLNSPLGQYITKVVPVDPKDPIKSKEDYLRTQPLKDSFLVGDTEVEYTLGKNLQISAYILNRGFRSKAFLEERGIPSSENLLKIDPLEVDLIKIPL